MKVKNIILVLAVLLLKHNASVSQTNDTIKNDFKIGIYGFDYMTNKPYNGNETDFCPVSNIDTIRNGQKYPTSQLNVLKEDGFNINLGQPDLYFATNFFIRNFMQLMKNHDMQSIPSMLAYYKPDSLFSKNRYDTIENDTNIYDFNPLPPKNCNWVARPNYDSLLRDVYFNPAFRDLLWGIYLTEEASYQHPQNPTDSVINWIDGLMTEIPPMQVAKAIEHFRTLKNSFGLNQKSIIICEAKHGEAIFDGCLERWDIDNNDHNLGCQPDMYLRPEFMGNNTPDVFFDGSYCLINRWVPWYTQIYDSILTNTINSTNHGYNDHYLANFKTIDWAYTHVNNVQDLTDISYDNKTIDTIRNEVGGIIRIDTLPKWQKYGFHSDINILNANWLWFQIYTTIIHGSKGVWFWSLRTSYAPGEEPPKDSISRFSRQYFPHVYKNYVSPLARELRYLVNKNILSTDPSTIIAKKTDNADSYNIISQYTSDVPTEIINDQNKSTAFRKEHTKGFPPYYVNNNYNLRYTIRSNGAETAMILTNPLGVSVKPTLNFSELAKKDDIIRNAKSYSILFENSFPSWNKVTGSTYKTTRDTISLSTMTLNNNQQYTSLFDTKIDTISFGPFDTHIIQFGPIDNQWFDELRDRTDAGNNDIRLKSQIRTDNRGNIYYVTKLGIINVIYMNNGKWQVDWLNGNAPRVLKGTGFDIDESNSKSLYYVSADNGKLWRLYYSNGWQFNQIDNYSAKVHSDSRVIYNNGQIYCVRENGRITATDKANGNTVVINPNGQVVKPGMGIALNDDGNMICYQGSNNSVYRILLDDNNQIETIYANVSTRANSELHFANNSIMFVDNNDILHSLWQDENAQWHKDWLGQDVKVKSNTDFDVFSHNWKSDVYYIGIDDYIYKFNGQIEKISPTALVKGRDSVDVHYANGKIYYGANNTKIHALSYRNSYYNGLDLYIKDTPEDLGNEPNNNSDCLYASEDIWVRNQDDGFEIQETENAVYYPAKPSYIYVRVRNKSSERSKGLDMLKLYWAKASAVLTWDNSWNGSITSPALMGDVVGTQFIPVIEAGEETILKFEWQVPNPDNYATLAEQWHFCLLARIESNDDPMTSEETDNLAANIQNNNNIASKNVSIVSGKITSIGLFNPFFNMRRLLLKFKVPQLEQPPFITNQAEVLVHLDDNLFSQFLANLSTAKNLRVYNSKTNTFIMNGDSASIQLNFNTDELNVLGMEYRFLTQQPSEKSKFNFDVVLCDLDNKIVGGERFIIRKPNRNQFKANAGDDQVITLGSSVLLSAISIGEDATYSWFEDRNDTIVEGQSIEVIPSKTKEYTLSVLTDDGFTDYDKVKVVVKELYITHISPNPTSNSVTIGYETSNTSTAILELMNSVGFVVATFPISANQTEYTFNVSSLPQGSYTVILTCDNIRKDAKTLIVN